MKAKRQGMKRRLSMFLVLTMITTLLLPITAFADLIELSGLDDSVDLTASAIAVSTDVTQDHGAADAIYLVFDQPTNGYDILGSLSLDGSNEFGTAAGTWDSTNTIYTIALANDTEISNGAKISYSSDGEFKNAEDKIVNSIDDIDIKGNFEGAGDFVEPTELTATIIKGSGRATASTDDKIIIVMNAPVAEYDSVTPADWISGLSDATGIWDATKTVYTITLTSNDTNLTDAAEVKFQTLATGLTGSFGAAVAPKALRALVVDNNGNANAEGDFIVISFDRPTNGAAINSAQLDSLIKNVGQGLGTDSTAVWNSEMTELTITVGATAAINNGAIINLGSLGIMDQDSIVSYVGTDITIEGSFGASISPKITRAVAFTQNNKHKIRVFFNTLVEPNGTLDIYIENFNDDNAAGNWTHNGVSYYDMVLGDGHDEFTTAVHNVVFDGTIVDSETKKSQLVDATSTIYGGFERDIEPEVLSLTAYSRDGSGIAKTGDKLILIFNSEVTSVSTALGTFETEDHVTWTYTLKNNHEVAVGENVSFDVKALGRSYTKTAVIGGSFGLVVEPKLLSATAYSNDGSGVAKAGDKIVLVFNTAVKDVTSSFGATQSDDNFIWTITLANDNSITVGTVLSFSAASVATDKQYNDLTAVLGGSFGEIIEPRILSATAVSNSGTGIAKPGDKIILVFNTAVLYLSSPLGNVTTSNNIVWEITLTSHSNVNVGDMLTFQVNSAATNKEYKNLTVSLQGSFGAAVEPGILSVTAVSNDGSGVAKAGDKLVVVFNTAVSGVASSLGTAATADQIVWTITLTSTAVQVGDEIGFEIKSVATDKEYTVTSTIGGSFGHEAELGISSAIVYYNNGEYINLVFNTATNGNTGLIETPTVKEALSNNNPKLDIAEAAFVDAYTFRIKLGTGSTIVEGELVDLSGIGITAKGTGKALQNATAELKGMLTPIVLKAAVEDKTITITFSSRTNGAGIEKIQSQTALYGSGVKAEWKENNTKLVIVMSDDHTMSDEAYMVLNGLDIYDGFKGTHKLVGQYKIDTTMLEKKQLKIVSAFVKTTNTEREDFVTGLEGDQVLVVFEDPTNKIAGSDASANIMPANETESFGEGFTAIWTDSKTITVTFGTAPVIQAASELLISNVKFANGTGFLSTENPDQIKVTLVGQFDGRAYWILNPIRSEVNGRTRVTAAVNKADITSTMVFTPYVVCEAYNKTNQVLSINAIKLSELNSNEVVFDFSTKNLIKVKLFVLTGEYTNPEAVTSVLAETVER